MTTNAVDRVKRILASDSRWSFLDESNGLLFFVDDTRFQKLIQDSVCVMVCAGYGPLIEEWQAWFRTEDLDFDKSPDLNRHVNGRLEEVAISVWVKSNCAPLYQYGVVCAIGDEAMFCGSGMEHAFKCFVVNRCSKQAVATAGVHDFYTGGTTIFVECDTGSHNLHDEQLGLGHVNEEFQSRGMVMDVQTKKVVSIEKFGTKGTEAFDGMVLSAPTGRPAHEWSPSEREQLRKAFEHVKELRDQATKRS